MRARKLWDEKCLLSLMGVGGVSALFPVKDFFRLLMCLGLHDCYFIKKKKWLRLCNNETTARKGEGDECVFCYRIKYLFS